MDEMYNDDGGGGNGQPYDDDDADRSSFSSTVSAALDLSSSDSTWTNDTYNASAAAVTEVVFADNAYYFYRTEQLIFLWILFALIVLGNSAVLAALVLSKNKKSRMNFFIMQLAIADLAVGLISVLTDIVWKITITWHAGNIACKIIRFLQVLVTYSSTYVLVALSVDRYDAITHPMNFSGSWKRARYLIVVAWSVSALFSLPILVLYEEKIIHGQAQCWIELASKWHWRVYMSLVAVALFIVPAIVITLCYTVIVYTIWSKGKILTPMKPRTKGDLAGKSQENDVDTKRASSRGLIPKAKIKTVKMTFSIVFVFILCWSPYIIYDLLQVYDYIPMSQTNTAVATFIQSLAPLNSAANPIIYCLFSTHICHNLRKISIIDWLVAHVCVCCPSARKPLQRETASTRRSDYTTMSESLSRSSRRSTTIVSTSGSRRFRANLALTAIGPSHNRKYVVASNGSASTSPNHSANSANSKV